MNIPTILVILGATGDLVKKKVMPALAHLSAAKALPEKFKIVAFSRREWNDAEFREYAASLLKEAPPENFLKDLSYVKGTFEDAESYQGLARHLKSIDDAWGICTNKLFYLAVPPASYETIFNHLASSGLTEPCGGDEGWTRVLVEKPFGSDAESAQDLDELLQKLFKEEQIYRIDHYLAKEMLQNVLAFRFSNELFKGIWNKDHIARIDISTPETLGVEDRGPFYEGVGTLRDVGQNHLLQMLALITMQPPGVLSSEEVRAKRAAILQTLVVPSAAEIEEGTYRAQYKGYRDIAGVASDSRTETYFRVAASLAHPDWQGVPIYLEAGKRLKLQKKEIVITFKHPSPCLCPADSPHVANKIIMRSEPREEIVIQFMAKRPGFGFALEERSIEINYRDPEAKRQQYTEEYEKLMLDAIAGDQTLFVSSAEIGPMWRFTDAIRKEWAKADFPLHEYEPGTDEILAEADAFLPNKIILMSQAALVWRDPS